MKHTHAKKNEMTRSMGMLPVIWIAVITLILGAAAPELWAADRHRDWFKVGEFEVAELYFELNNTDGDLGIHGKIDGGPWKSIWIKDPNHRQMMRVTARGRLRQQAVTELFFESAEPTFEDLTPEDFFNRFPEGDYKIFGWSQDRELLVSTSEIRHVMPAPPDGIEVSGTPIDLEVVDCDDPPVVVPDENGNIIISWDDVDSSHPTIGEAGAIEVALYQLVVETEVEVNGEEFESVFSIDLPLNVTSMTVPADFIDLGLDEDGEGEFKFEILVKEEQGGNQTATESCFAIGGEDGGEEEEE